MNKKALIPVLLGADLNCYSVARAFHEKYKVNSYAFGRYAIGATANSKIINFRAVENLNTEDVLLKTLEDFAKDHHDADLIAMGCTDEYVELLSALMTKLPQYTIPYIDRELLDRLVSKDVFYDYCEKYGISYPKTVVFSDGDTLDNVDIEYPMIIKPALSSLYWKTPFDGMKKVYRAKSRAEAESILSSIFGSGYSGKVILQDTIPGNDSSMRVLTCYSDSKGKVRMMCLGHVLLEEHTPKGLGNHAAIITEYDRELMEKLKAFLEDIGYVGFSNFDIKYDKRDGSYRAFEINVRQGRSNYYVTSAGNNVAEYVVSDFVYGEELEGCKFCDEEIYWRYIPDSVVFNYVDDNTKKKIKELKKSGKAFSSMRYKYDLKGNLKRSFFVLAHEFNHIKKFKKYLNKQEYHSND